MSRRIILAHGELRFLFAGPYKTRKRAEIALEDLYSDGDVCAGERPEVTTAYARYWVSVPA